MATEWAAKTPRTQASWGCVSHFTTVSSRAGSSSFPKRHCQQPANASCCVCFSSLLLLHSFTTLAGAAFASCSLRYVVDHHDIWSTMIEPSIRIRRAINADDAALLRRILKSHPSLLHNPDPSPSGLSNSNMHLAASLGHRDICAVLLELGHEDPCPALNELHQTALMLAAGAGHTEVVHLLCEKDKSCIIRRDSRGRDAVMEASLGGHDTILQLLLTFAPGGPYEAVRRADVEGNTALHFASGNGNLLVLRTLLAAGADVEKRNIWNWTPAAYSATVQAEVYLKGLVSEVGKRRQMKREVEASKKGAGVRVVEATSDDE
ncbi:ankyrin repeat-containing domain protein [Dactylonectria estremocensis]|uniref:Ankyrin repeat-containing domain protein n=1 Tax=Dactylonectria estremocensis TaxID=1079267 RepID=A0A9P9JBW5_9HYPO|nr:ankyrin repeat-containing domain protein [Dactylonectria estremocensis]